MNRDRIKLIAIIAMALNHISIAFELPFALDYIFSSIGYCTLPIMVYFLVEGYWYTHSKMNYLLRLLFFGLISQIPYHLGLYLAKETQFVPLNIFFTLSLCFLIVDIYNRDFNLLLKIASISLLFFLSKIMDWAYFAPLYALFFCFAYGDKRSLKYGFVLISIFISMYQAFEMMHHASIDISILYGLGFLVGTLLSAVLILFAYNGTKSEKNHKGAKWFFYIFYPLHLLMLWLISLAL